MKHLLFALGTLAMLGAPLASGGPRKLNPEPPVSLQDSAPLTAMSREPMWLINCFSGKRDSINHPEEDYTGLRGEWRGPRAMEWLEDQLRTGYALGARKFWIVRPMGTDGESNVSASAWLTIPEYKREPMQERINRLIFEEFDEPVKIYYFIGSYMQDPWSLRGHTGQNQDSVFRLGDDSYEAQAATRLTLGGLMSAGAAGFGIDASAVMRCRDHYVQFAEQLRRPPFNLECVGEALPVVVTSDGRGVVRDEKGDFMLDQDALTRMAWVGTTDYLGWRFRFRTFDPETTRVYKWYPWDSEYEDLNLRERQEMVAADMRRGFILITHDPTLMQAALTYYHNPQLLEDGASPDDPSAQVSADPIPRRTLVD